MALEYDCIQDFTYNPFTCVCTLVPIGYSGTDCEVQTIPGSSPYFICMYHAPVEHTPSYTDIYIGAVQLTEVAATQCPANNQYRVSYTEKGRGIIEFHANQASCEACICYCHVGTLLSKAALDVRLNVYCGVTCALCAFASVDCAIYACATNTRGVYSQAQYHGLYGCATCCYGIYGKSDICFGLYGSAASYGVYGTASANCGVFGTACNYGVYGQSVCNYGIFGIAGACFGVYGNAALCGVYGTASCCGVYGNALYCYGVRGCANDCYGVTGVATTAFGVTASAPLCAMFALSSNNYAIYGQSGCCFGVVGTASCFCGVVGSSTCCGVVGVITNARPVAGNGAYFDTTSSRNLKLNKENICILDCFRQNPDFNVQKWQFADFNQFGYDYFIGPYAEDLRNIFGLTFEDQGYYTVDGIALGASIELYHRLVQVEKKIKILEEKIGA